MSMSGPSFRLSIVVQFWAHQLPQPHFACLKLGEQYGMRLHRLQVEVFITHKGYRLQSKSALQRARNPPVPTALLPLRLPSPNPTMHPYSPPPNETSKKLNTLPSYLGSRSHRPRQISDGDQTRSLLQTLNRLPMPCLDLKMEERMVRLKSDRQR